MVVYGLFLTMYDVLPWWGSCGAQWKVLDCSRSLQLHYVQGSVDVVLVFCWWRVSVLLVFCWHVGGMLVAYWWGVDSMVNNPLLNRGEDGMWDEGWNADAHGINSTQTCQCM